MLSIGVELLTGRYSATAFDDRTVPEWPPHPARLLSALVATWADADEPDADERAALRWLERQAPPAITCSAGDKVSQRDPVTCFVPVNDPTALRRDISSSYERISDAAAAVGRADAAGDRRMSKRAGTALARTVAQATAAAARVSLPTGTETSRVSAGVLEVLPDNRSKQARHFPTVRPDDPRVRFDWPDTEPSPGQLDALDRLLARVGRLGHSSTFVSCCVTDERPQAPPTYVAEAETPGELVLRVPRMGMVDRLERMFEAHQGREQRVMPAGTAEYGRFQPHVPSPPRPALGGDWIILPMPRSGGDDDARRPPVLKIIRSLELARAVRGALLRHSPTQPPAEVLCGHSPRSGDDDRPTAPSERSHLAVVPLPDVVHRHSGAVIHGVALVLPTDVSDVDRSAVEDALGAWTRANGREVFMTTIGGPSFRLDPPILDRARRAGTGVGGLLGTAGFDDRRTLRRGLWCRPSTTWVSVTPLALDRFPGELRRGHPARTSAAEHAATESIARSCAHIDLPEPATVAISVEGLLAAVPAVGGGTRRRGGARFAGYAAGSSGQRRLCVHARITFDEEVAGPVLLGAGRYLGFGLFLPVDRRGAGTP